MRCRVEQHGGVTVVHLAGRVTIGQDLDQFREAFEESLDDGHHRFVVDLDEVSYVDSATLGEIIACRRRARAVGGALVLTRARGKVRDLLELTRIGELVEIHATIDGAVASLSS
ncbi:MAG: STAS domain-containing protein [Acidobacteriota bacterium]|nr:MAG: STAS domain-containing protein [Acidobacteriota bacterium]